MADSHNAIRRRLLLGGTALCASLALSRRAASADFSRPIEIGIRPSLPTAMLMAGHQSLRLHFEQTFKRPVALSTAPDFSQFQRRVLRGDFDFIIIGPGPGWQAHLDRGYPIIAVSQQMVRVYILVAKDGPIKNIADLSGKTLATIGPLTVSSQIAQTILREHKLQPGVDVQIQHMKNPFNVAQLVAQGDVAAASFPNISFPSLPAAIAGKLRILYEAEPIPGIFFMVRPASDMPSPKAFQAALFNFAKETPAGRAYIKDFSHEALTLPDLDALRVLDRFLPEIRQTMTKS
ncbi:MAG: phosphate/phosphite/phosphonate ABC transporter substrate-binding protein [Gammaproteobacteria bacterium]|nr:phosphate/phosphite/phosphonate ABC transporter substrate-binding protein [Rhodocyclaceae bacterium]MBU3910739.1 phosphate/phosphite/phosphonate ABC transporter substrate-binding protein [Gammaproteobacteria bacterium]MBU3988904.1 phosphate/phosphite/phosphonate ABC transporter substrate-binding protein [Gammaproteobacteria bacterium]MBU4003449.1 phosphate/phosphite/phosphonate ABC transporter substrate-binding protein [Gammaproteobacteria bacterium]MBU4021919.1 phosphate/phosphite/phosphona